MDSVLKLYVASVVLYAELFNGGVCSEQFQDGGRDAIMYSRDFLMLRMSHTDSKSCKFLDFPHEMYATADIPPPRETNKKGKRGRLGGVKKSKSSPFHPL